MGGRVSAVLEAKRKFSVRSWVCFSNTLGKVAFLLWNPVANVGTGLLIHYCVVSFPRGPKLCAHLLEEDR